MAHIHTHYDNLKVTRTAPPEVIRAAYKSLSQKFHPDRNPDKQNATRTIQIINLAYEVLSDPVKRREHDEWIAATEAKNQAHERSQHVGYGAVPPFFHTKNNGLRSLIFGKHKSKKNHSLFTASKTLSKARFNMHQALRYLFLSAIATAILWSILAG